MFAKLYDTKELGQILVKIDQGEGETEAEVRFYVEPPNLGVCSFSCGFNDWEKAGAMFDKMDESAAISTVEPFLATAAQFAPEGEDEDE